MEQNNIKFQLVPTHIHIRKKGERAIQTFKSHLISGLCTVNPNFPLHIWEKLIPQLVITLNMIRRSRINPKLSVYQQLYGIYDYNATRIVPLGTKLIAYKAPKNGNHTIHTAQRDGT